MSSDSKKKIIIIGPAHPLRGGGITTFNQRLARAFIEEGHRCEIFSFYLQYPSFLFPGKNQYTDEPAPEGLTIHSAINSIHPINWIRVGNRIRREQPDLVIVRYWLPLMGPALGTILRRVKKNPQTKVICIADNIIPHEKRPGDKPFTSYFVKACDAFITMSEKVLKDLRLFEKKKPALLVRHPLYDNFGSAVSKDEAKARLNINSSTEVVLFFGFIRQYKGLDLLLEAVAQLKKEQQWPSSRKLLIAGEFYEPAEKYHQLIDQLGIRDELLLKTDFIPDQQVKYYLCAADVVVQPYRNATQSGVTPLAYHFEKPMIITNVGGLPDLVPHEKTGLVAEPNADAIAHSITRFYELGENYFIPHLREEKNKLSWPTLVNAILDLAAE